MSLERIVWDTSLKRFMDSQGKELKVEPIGSPKIIVLNAVGRSAPETADAYCLGEAEYFGNRTNMAVQYYHRCPLSPREGYLR